MYLCDLVLAPKYSKSNVRVHTVESENYNYLYILCATSIHVLLSWCLQVALVTFDNKVRYYGDGSQGMNQLDAGSLDDFQALMTQGKMFGSDLSLRELQDSLRCPSPPPSLPPPSLRPPSLPPSLPYMLHVLENVCSFETADCMSTRL